jgi:hypothetical protein
MQRCKADLPVAAAAQCLKVLLQLGGAPATKALVDAGETPHPIALAQRC